MPTLRERTAAAVADLAAVATSLSYAGSTLPSKSKDFFQEFAAWSIELQEVTKLMDVRDSALRQIVLLSDPRRHCPTHAANSLWNGDSIPYWHARLLAFQGYMASTWAAYDTLGKVAGRLCLNEKQAKNAASPMKLRYFLDKAGEGPKTEGIGFLMASQLKQAYGWPIGFSYASRNWVMHEGHFQDGALLFDGEDRLATRHRLTEAAYSKISADCTEYGVTEAANTISTTLPADARADFLLYLTSCHREVDECIGLLLAWACASARLQAQLFLELHSIFS